MRYNYYNRNNPVEDELLAVRANRLRTVIPRELFPDQVSFEKEIARTLANGCPNDKVNDKILIGIYSEAFKDIEGWSRRDRKEEVKSALKPFNDNSVSAMKSDSRTYSMFRHGRREYAKAI